MFVYTYSFIHIHTFKPKQCTFESQILALISDKPSVARVAMQPNYNKIRLTQIDTDQQHHTWYRFSAPLE